MQCYLEKPCLSQIHICECPVPQVYQERYSSKITPVTALWREGCKGTPHIGLHVTRRLITDLDTILQDALGNNLGLQEQFDSHVSSAICLQNGSDMNKSCQRHHVTRPLSESLSFVFCSEKDSSGPHCDLSTKGSFTRLPSC